MSTYLYNAYTCILFLCCIYGTYIFDLLLQLELVRYTTNTYNFGLSFFVFLVLLLWHIKKS